MPTDPRLWMTRRQAAELCGLSPKTLDDAIRPLLPTAAVKGSGKSLRLLGPAVVQVHVERRAEQLRAATASRDSDDDGAVSPALERKREIEAELLQRKLAELDGRLVEVETFTEAVMPAIGGMRGAGRQLGATYGNDAVEIFNDAVSGFERAVVRFLDRAAEGKAKRDDGDD